MKTGKSELQKSLYVDDLISGKMTVAEAQTLKERAIEIFDDATFTLHKWHSNTPKLEDAANNPTDEQTFAKQQLGNTNRGESSILGLRWDKKLTKLASQFLSEETATTKRGTLQRLAKIYDPLGLASPQTLQGKLICREACQMKLGWDAPIGNNIKQKWLQWEQSLPRQVNAPHSLVNFREAINSIELHAFGDASGEGDVSGEGDASGEGVASAVYAVVRQPSGVSQGLVAAKARLAKQGLTIPCLELMSAHMATNLIRNVQRALEGSPVVVLQGWLDSTVALHWINGGGDFKQFVAKLVAKIKSNNQLKWHHVPTKENPADLEVEVDQCKEINFGGRVLIGLLIDRTGHAIRLLQQQKRVMLKPK